MTESEAKRYGEDYLKDLVCAVCKVEDRHKDFVRMSIKALEKQIEMKRYCDENGCANCPYHNSSINDNRCMNDFIIEME